MSRNKHALVLVFGDLGHSPRMQNHVWELVKIGYSVTFAGYSQSSLPTGMNTSTVNIMSLPAVSLKCISWLPVGLGFLIQAIVKIFVQALYVLWVGLFKTPRLHVIIVQSPPALPTLLVGPLLAWWHKSQYIVDWHNVGYTILAQTVKMPAIIGLAKATELYLSRFANVSLVVSKAQQQWMQVNGGMKSIVVYDRPNTDLFKIPSPVQRREFRKGFAESYGWDLDDDSALVVSSTSWTPDEDFWLFGDALNILNKQLRSRGGRLYVVITGKGPLKSQFEEYVKTLSLSHVSLVTCWLSYEDYAKLLGSADLGVSLHSSSSGVDLPMKAIDMIAVNLPVIAFRYAAIQELVPADSLFSTKEGLADLIFRSVIAKSVTPCQYHLESWSEHWQASVRPLLP